MLNKEIILRKIYRKIENNKNRRNQQQTLQSKLFVVGMSISEILFTKIGHLHRRRRQL